MRKPSILRIGVWALIVAIGAAFVWFVLPMFFFAAIIFLGRNETQQLQRVESPDRRMAAILVETTPSFSIESDGLDIFIVPTGENTPTGKPLLEGIGLRDLKLAWLSPKVLQISYSSGCIGSFHNSWLAMDQNGQPFDQNGSTDYVEIRLKAPNDGAPYTCD